jgi:hypothetical protein
MKIVMAGILVLVLAGCAAGSADCQDARVGRCKVNFARVFTDTTLGVKGLGGSSIDYNSNPNAQMTSELMGVLVEALIRRGAPLSDSENGGGGVDVPPHRHRGVGVEPMPPLPPIPQLQSSEPAVILPEPYITRVSRWGAFPMNIYEVD